jgi:hypothetical protein
VSAQNTPVQFGQTVGADFEASTMTLQMEPGYIVAVGPVAVLPLAIYEALLEALSRIAALDPEQDTDEGFNEWGEALCFNKAQDIARAAIAKATGSAAA